MSVSKRQYERFGAWLRASDLRRVTLGFGEIEAVIGAKLPASALRYNAWWSNSLSQSLAKVWLEAGWEVPDEGLNWGRKEITLERRGPAAETTAAEGSPTGRTQVAPDRVLNRARVPEDWHELASHATRIAVKVEREADGSVRHFQPQSGYAKRDEVPLNSCGTGSFCKFGVPKDLHGAGVYLIVTGDRLAYVGECQDFSQRFNTGYGHISPKNCYKGGQETNCRINQLIMNCAGSGLSIDVYFLKTDDPEDRFPVETACIAAYAPHWNRRG